MSATKNRKTSQEVRWYNNLDKICNYLLREEIAERANINLKNVPAYLKKCSEEKLFPFCEKDKFYFLEQPFGSQSDPDFLIYTNSDMRFFDVKETKKDKKCGIRNTLSRKHFIVLV